MERDGSGGVAFCDVCRCLVLVRPGTCYGCRKLTGRRAKLPNPPPHEMTPERELRLREYARRAAAGLSLFGVAKPNQRRSN